MLKDRDSSAIVAVRDIAAARRFYADILGIEPLREDDRLLVFRTGATRLVVYVSEFAGTNQANAAVWGVGDEIEAIVSALLGKGVSFEQYPGMDYKGGIHSAGDYKGAWFRDPDGNILHLNNL